MDEPLKQLEKRLDQHIEDTNARLERGDEKMDSLIECSRKNSEAIENLVKQTGELTDAVENVTKSTSGMVQLWRDAQGVIRIGAAVKRIALFIISVPIIGEFYKWVLNLLHTRGILP
jgi:methyl-accepting chemotaxis protein